MSDPSSDTTTPRATCAVSGHLDTRTAAIEVAHELHEGIGDATDLVLVFASYHHRSALPEAVETIRQTINPGTILAVTAEGVLGARSELEGLAGLSALAMQLPGVELSVWCSTPDDPIPLDHAHQVSERIHLSEDFRAAILIAEPFTTPITKLLPAISSCGGPSRSVPVVGGLASGASQPGQNVLIVNDQVMTKGAVGVSLAGDLAVDFVVSQGCRPVGSTLVITRAKGRTVTELGGRPALDVVREMARSLPEPERELLTQGLLIGHVIDEHKASLGRGDFLIRSLLGFDESKNGVVVAETPRLGQKVQFHLRDAVTAAEDLQLLLDAQVMSEPPFAALLFSCNGRGKRLFGEPNHDITIIADRLGQVPIAGFFAAGEIGPVGAQLFVHGHTASLALFRSIN